MNSSNVPPRSIAAHNATRVSLPAQIGRATLYQAAEVSDAVCNIRVVCNHAFQLAGLQLAPHYLDRLNTAMPSGDRLTLAQAARVLALWHRWTRAEFPGTHEVTGFIFSLNR